MGDPNRFAQGRGYRPYNPEKHHRRSIRLRNYDYSQTGVYFITLCTQNRECWFDIPVHFPHVELDEWVIMPNHVHGIWFIMGIIVGAKIFSPLPTTGRPRGTSKTIGPIMRGFKIGVTKWMRQNNVIHNVWQRNYYEHIIRDETELSEMRKYIINNPINWQNDKNYIYKIKGRR